MFSQFFILSLRGDTIIFRDYRGDVTKEAPEIFFQHIKSSKKEVVPIFNLDGVNYIYLKQPGLFLVFTTKQNVGPNFALELLFRLSKLFKDYCGVFTEESIRKNFVLIYELLDESLDFGYPQGISTEHLKAFVFNEPVVIEEPKDDILDFMNPIRKTMPSSATNQPIILDYEKARNRKNEIFVDLIEKLTILFSPTGEVLRSEIEGMIMMKSYLKGNPEVLLALNEDLVIGSANKFFGVVLLDDITFHECVRFNNWERERELRFFPPEGEFSVLNYRISDEFKIPFRITPLIDEVYEPAHRLDLVVKINANMPETNYGGNVIIRFPVPKSTVGVSFDMMQNNSSQTVEYKKNDKVVEWQVKKFVGGTEHLLRAKITVGTHTSVRKEIGPISMNFEIPMYNCSRVTIRHLRINNSADDSMSYRWVRYLTKSDSYVARVG